MPQAVKQRFLKGLIKMDDNENFESENAQDTGNGGNPSFGRSVIGEVIAGEIKREVKHGIFDAAVGLFSDLFSDEE